MSGTKDIQQLIGKLKREGYEVSQRKRNPHYRVKCPDGSTCVISSTPGDHRTLLNVKSALVRRGVPHDVVGFFPEVELRKMIEDGEAEIATGDLPPTGSLIKLVPVDPTNKRLGTYGPMLVREWVLVDVAASEKDLDLPSVDRRPAFDRYLITEKGVFPAYEGIWKIEVLGSVGKPSS
tara:strand:+ start:344 stop:877 length:534 start_codon:yes stop_codon:yes gene_type:complete